MPADMFVRRGDVVDVAMPVCLVELLDVVDRKVDAGDHPLAAMHPGPLASVAGAESDPLANLEQEIAADALAQRLSAAIAEQRSVVGRLAALPRRGGATCGTLSAEDTFALLGWANRMFVRTALADIGDVPVGDGESPATMLGLEEPTMGVLAGASDVPLLFASLAHELTVALTA